MKIAQALRYLFIVNEVVNKLLTSARCCRDGQQILYKFNE